MEVMLWVTGLRAVAPVLKVIAESFPSFQFEWQEASREGVWRRQQGVWGTGCEQMPTCWQGAV